MHVFLHFWNWLFQIFHPTKFASNSDFSNCSVSGSIDVQLWFQLFKKWVSQMQPDIFLIICQCVSQMQPDIFLIICQCVSQMQPDIFLIICQCVSQMQPDIFLIICQCVSQMQPDIFLIICQCVLSLYLKSFFFGSDCFCFILVFHPTYTVIYETSCLQNFFL